MPRPFPEAPSFGGPTDSSHYDCRLRGKGQPLEGDLEQTSLTTKSRWGFEPVFEPEPGRVFNHAEARTASRALADLCPRNAGMNRRAQRSSHAAIGAATDLSVRLSRLLLSSPPLHYPRPPPLPPPAP